MAPEGWRRTARLALIGFVLPIPLLVALRFVPEPGPTRTGAVLLALIAAVYAGFALLDGRIRWIAVELTVVVGFGFVALFALERPWLLGLGLLGHAVWDALHHPRMIPTEIPRWYPPFCAAADLCLALPFLLSGG